MLLTCHYQFITSMHVDYYFVVTLKAASVGRVFAPSVKGRWFEPRPGEVKSEKLAPVVLSGYRL